VSGQTPLSLMKGRARCNIHAAIGGSLGRWSIGEQDMLRRASPAAVASRDVLGMSTFPLVPYSNRIGDARFDWHGERIALRPNFAPEQHAIHGVGWLRSWTIAAQDDASATLQLEHFGDEDWPWPFLAQQRVLLDEDRLTLELTVVNRAPEAVPLAFGHHPYFDAGGATLTFAADRVWLSGPDSLPTIAIEPAGPLAFGGRVPVAGRDVDHCYTGVRGSAMIDWADRPMMLEVTTVPPLPVAVVYVPRTGSAFCFEPVPHINNALNMLGQHPAMPIVSPGARLSTALVMRALRNDR
jgi:aldose 1-epimerase